MAARGRQGGKGGKGGAQQRRAGVGRAGGKAARGRGTGGRGVGRPSKRARDGNGDGDDEQEEVEVEVEMDDEDDEDDEDDDEDDDDDVNEDDDDDNDSSSSPGSTSPRVSSDEDGTEKGKRRRRLKGATAAARRAKSKKEDLLVQKAAEAANAAAARAAATQRRDYEEWREWRGQEGSAAGGLTVRSCAWSRVDSFMTRIRDDEGASADDNHEFNVNYIIRQLQPMRDGPADDEMHVLLQLQPSQPAGASSRPAETEAALGIVAAVAKMSRRVLSIEFKAIYVMSHLRSRRLGRQLVHLAIADLAEQTARAGRGWRRGARASSRRSWALWCCRTACRPRRASGWASASPWARRSTTRSTSRRRCARSKT